MSWQAGNRLRIPEASAEILASLGEHRILSTDQVGAIHYPDRSPRRTQQALAYLERAGLIAHVETRRTPRRVWFLTGPLSRSPPRRIGHRALRFTGADLEEWIAQNTYGARRNR